MSIIRTCRSCSIYITIFYLIYFILSSIINMR
nr:MAG TPA: hypothetical protein [Crassvirales sp.]